VHTLIIRGEQDMIRAQLAVLGSIPLGGGSMLFRSRYPYYMFGIWEETNISKSTVPEEGKTLQDTVEAALLQIKDRQYAAILEKKGIPSGRIRCYGFAFEGKRVLIG